MIANCPECNKLFTPKPGLRVCHLCSIVEQENYQKVYGYMLKHPDSDIPEVSEKTGIPQESILRLVQQGRFQSAKAFQKRVPSCNRCSKALSEAEIHGREGNAKLICRPCSSIMANQFLALGHDPRTLQAGSPESADVVPKSMHGSRHSEKRYGIGSNRA
jgi:DNA-directed RNA polymerase subunit M/transcription elongation factor TFIIS